MIMHCIVQQCNEHSQLPMLAFNIGNDRRLMSGKS